MFEFKYIEVSLIICQRKPYNTLKNNIFIKIQFNFINEYKTNSNW